MFDVVDFDSDSTADDIRFVIKRLKIWTDSSASGYPFSGNMDVRTFLEVLPLSVCIITRISINHMTFIYTQRRTKKNLR